LTQVLNGKIALAERQFKGNQVSFFMFKLLLSRNINAEETCCSCRQLNSQFQKYFFTAKIILFYIPDIKYFHIKNFHIKSFSMISFILDDS